MANPFFSFRQFTVYQDRCAMKVGTDGTLLGAWAMGGERILDIGTGTSLIALMMAQRYGNARVWGVEIDEAAARQAKENARNSPFQNRVSIIQGDIAQCVNSESPINQKPLVDQPEAVGQSTESRWSINQNWKFDAIVCNPPFFVNSLPCPEREKAIAKHTGEGLDFGTLCGIAKELLGEGGEFSVIIPSEVTALFNAEAALAGLFPHRICAVRTTPRKPVRRFLLSFTDRHVEVERQEEVIETAPNVRSAWYKALTKDFYLDRK